MSIVKIVPIVYLKEKLAYHDEACSRIIGDGDLTGAAGILEKNGADELLIVELSDSDFWHDANIGEIRKIHESFDIPFNVTGSIKRLEDVKKYLYAGAKRAVIDYTQLDIMRESAKRFGGDKTGVLIPVTYFDTEIADLTLEMGVHSYFSTNYEGFTAGNEFFMTDASPESDFYAIKDKLKERGFDIVCINPQISVSFDSLIPVVVQDYKTNDVLMLAYMNEQAYNMTLKTGKMHYYSRSRQCLWLKGETSGHYQYVRSLKLDCDGDTILAKVRQIGSACHTGSRSCFFNTIADLSDDASLQEVLSSVFSVINDRKLHPKEGSYTNYLFDKGIDKILKKVGEEAAETIIAAKNPDGVETVYEIADLLYHLMVLMSYKDITWDDVMEELSRR